MIERIRLTNWKSHLSSDLKFSAGVNALTGAMGSGKTSIVEAISFALFGTFPSLKSHRVGLDELIMKKPEKKELSRVELNFSLNGNDYYIVREIRAGKGTGKCEIRKDGEILDVNARGVTREVERCLQMDYDTFSKAVYSEQNGIDYFLRIPRGKRKDEIDRMLKVDKFEAARLEAVSLKNKVRNGIEERLKIVYELEKEDMSSGLKDAKDALKLINEEEAELTKEQRVKGAVLEGLEQRIDMARKIQEESNRLETQLEGAKATISQASESISMLKLGLSGRSVKDITSGLEKDALELEEFEKQLKDIQINTDQNRETLARNNGLIKALRDGRIGLSKAGATCPICEREINDNLRDSLIKNKDVDETRLMEIARKSAGVISELIKKKDILEEKRVALIEEMSELKSLRTRLAELMELEKNRDEAKIRENDLRVKLESTKKRVSESGIKDIEEKKRDIIGEIGGISAKLDSITQRVRDKEAIISALMERAELLKKYKTGIGFERDVITGLKTFENVIKITQDQLREEFLKTVNATLSQIWDDLYPYGDFSGIRLAIKEDYILQLKEDAGWTSVEGGISGGERSLAALALRIAFSMAFLPNLQWLILDEPTHNLDSRAITEFSTVLREKMGLFTEQVFLITHEQRIREGVTGNMYVLERDKDKDEPTRVVAA